MLNLMIIVFDRLRAFLPIDYHPGNLEKSYQNDEYLKQEMQKSCLHSGSEPAAY